MEGHGFSRAVESLTRDGFSRWVRADVAQLVEHSLGKGEVTSSILVIGSRFCSMRCREGALKGRGFSRAAAIEMEKRL